MRGFVRPIGLLVLGAFFLWGWSACIRRRAPEVTFEVNLYSGIPEFAKLGDSEETLKDRTKRLEPEISELPPRTVASDQPNFTKVYYFRDYGLRAFFQAARVALIQLQDPFRGTIQGKKLQIFSFAPPEGASWEDLLIREFGTPVVKASGGRFGSEGFFYSWGDISFNRMGPNELAIYRDSLISNFRQKNFGRDVKFFQ